jgi:hypothetical protein
MNGARGRGEGMQGKRVKAYSIVILVVLVVAPYTAQAYVGPGVGLSALGSILAFVGTILLMLLGFVWYPLKRVLRHLREKHNSHEDGVVEGEHKNRDKGG